MMADEDGRKSTPPLPAGRDGVEAPDDQRAYFSAKEE